MIAAVCQPLATKPPNTEWRGRLGVEMKELRIELAREPDDLGLVDRVRSADESLTHVQVIEVERRCSLAGDLVLLQASIDQREGGQRDRLLAAADPERPKHHATAE